jgi:nucleoside-diphosphate-sugar epimerase
LTKPVGILGCGWLGTPLATRLLRQGFPVRGTTTQGEKVPSLKALGIEAYRLVVGEKGIEGPVEAFLKGLHCLVVDIPPGLRADPGSDFTSRASVLQRALSEYGVPHLVFVSSTSVFGQGQGEVSEADEAIPDTESGRQLLEAEHLFLSDPNRLTQVVRPGGLLGPDRHPVRVLSGREFQAGGNQRVNLIRREDLIEALTALISGAFPPGIYHAVYPEYPAKRVYYTREAHALGVTPPLYAGPPGPPTGKQVLSTRFAGYGIRFTRSIYSELRDAPPAAVGD